MLTSLFNGIMVYRETAPFTRQKYRATGGQNIGSGSTALLEKAAVISEKRLCHSNYRQLIGKATSSEEFSEDGSWRNFSLLDGFKVAEKFQQSDGFRVFRLVRLDFEQNGLGIRLKDCQLVEQS